MTVIRCFAILDRIQRCRSSVYHSLVDSGARAALVAHLLSIPPRSSVEQAGLECGAAVEAYVAAYRGIDFSIFDCLQSFRNHEIAHLSMQEAKRIIFAELNDTVKTCCVLAANLNLLSKGLDRHRFHCGRRGRSIWLLRAIDSRIDHIVSISRMSPLPDTQVGRAFRRGSR